jgi:hypothetical protein
MSDRIARLTVLVVAAAFALAAPAVAATDRCAAVANSVLAEPDWYLDECLGGVPPEAPRAAPGPWRVPGDLFFLHNVRAAGPWPSSVVTAPIPTYTATVLGPNANPNFAVNFDLQANVLYGINNTTRQLGTYDQTTGAFTPTVTLTGVTAGQTIGAIEFDPTSANVYLCTGTELYTVNITSGAATLVGLFGGGVLVVDCAIAITGEMYAHDIALDNLLSINKTTGAATVIGPTTVLSNFAQGMDFDWSDNTLYGFQYTGAGVNNLVRFNTATGQATVIIPGPNGPEIEGAVKVASALALEPAALVVDAGGNGVLQPNESGVSVAPSWSNPNSSAVANVTGALGNFTGPAGPLYVITDGAAAYGTVAANSTQQCTDCYAVSVTAGSRPAAHWDATADETLSPAAPVKTWTLHVGDSFTDVPATNPFYRFIETIVHHSVTGGCSATAYCPISSTTREQMAVFVLVSKEGASYSPPACAAPNLFNDVPDTSPFCRWIEELANRQVVTGCGPSLYCPTAAVTREQMAVFALRTLDPALNPPACVAGSEMFADMPASNGFCRWVEELARRGVVTGCGGGNYCGTAPVSREQMGVFLSVTFSLLLYGV